MPGKVKCTFVVILIFTVGQLCAQSFPGNAAAVVPTVVTKIIDPDNGPGTDYTSLEAFATLEKRDLVAAGEIAVALCRSSNGSPDGPAQFDGWVTDAEHYVIVMADSGHRAGALWDETKYRIVEQTSGNSECIDVEIDYMVIDGIQMRLSGSGTNNDVIDVQGNAALLVVKNCFIWMDISTVSGTGLDPKNSLEVYNCIFKSSGGGSSAIYLKNSSSNPAGTVVNNTFVGGWEHAIRTEGSCRAINNLVRDCQSADVFLAADGGSFTTDSDYNSTNHSGAALVNSPRQSTASPWYNGGFSDSDIFINAGNNDYRLLTDAPVLGVGIGPAGSSFVPVTDIDGDSRTGMSTDLGATRWIRLRRISVYRPTVSISVGSFSEIRIPEPLPCKTTGLPHCKFL